MALTLAQKSQIRRHLNYEAVGFASGSAGGGGTLGNGQGFFSTSSSPRLEEKMNSLEPGDEAALVGNAYSSIRLNGLAPAEGDTLTLTFANLSGATVPLASSPLVLIVTCGPDQAGSLSLFALQVSTAIAQDSLLAAAGFQSLAPIDPTSVEVVVTNTELFSVTAAVSGQFAAVRTANGDVYPEPSVPVGKSAGVPIIKYGYLPILNYLYGAIGTATTRQGTLQADVFKARQDEVAARRGLYEYYLAGMANFLGVSTNPQPTAGRKAYGQIRL